MAIVLGSIGIIVCGAVRDLGRRLQPELWASWGGSPTLRRLRWRDTTDPRAVQRLHLHLAQLLNEALPTREDEAADPTAADRRYNEAIAVLRERTRERQRFPLVFEENAEYGFRRNCLGLRPLALTITLTILVISTLLIILASGPFSQRLGSYGSTALIAAVAAVAWWRLVTPDWVKRAANLYADRLFEVLSTLRHDAKGR